MSGNLFNDLSDVFKTIDKLEDILLNYVNSTVNSTYISVEENIGDIVNEIILNRQNVNSNNLAFRGYAKKQVELIDNAIKIIENSKFENLNLYKAFETIKNNLISKQSQFLSITKINNDLSSFDEIKKNLKNNIKYYEMKFQMETENYVKECLRILQEFEPSQLVKILSQINNDIFKNDIDNFYNIYCNNMIELNKKTGELDIQDLSKFVISDRKSMGEIIDLLSNFELSFISYPDNDIMLIKIISKSVLDIMMQTQNDFKEIQKFAKIELVSAKPISLISFKNIVERNSLEILSNEDTFMKFANLVSKIDELFVELNKMFCFKVADSVKKDDFYNLKEVQVINSLIIIFKDIISDIENNYKSISDEKIIEIISGILETIKIKVGNLMESKDDLEKCFINNCIKINALLFNDIKNEMLNQSNIVERINNVTKMIENIDADEDLEKYESQIFEDELHNITKNIILQEISTFEEIVNHSLKGLECEDFVNSILVSNDKIISLLLENGIQIICPDENDKFNSKEHFVIVAEKDDNYSKGDIIKCINIGFKENDIVLVKANVICAM